MTQFGRIAHVSVAVLVSGSLSVAVAPPAQASVSTLCSGYAACASVGMSESGYGAASRTAYWRMYTGHNCTNYAAYRMVRAGLANVRPWSGSGNATGWGTELPSLTNGTPSVGAVAWWKAGVRPAGSAGHVGYVERVVSATEIIVSQDSWHGDFSWTRVRNTGSGWPSGFIHFRDVPLLNTRAPTITGSAKVGSALSASPGTWSPSSAALAYQWMQNGAPIAGATGPSLVPKPEQQGKILTVRVTAGQLGYRATGVVSARTGVVLPGMLANTIRPAVIGASVVGSTLTSSAGSWNAFPEQLRYQWRAAGVPVPGATASTFVVDPSLVGKPVSVSVTAARSGYAAVTATSVPIGSVRPGSMRLAGAPSVSGLPQPGRVLSLHQPSVVPWPEMQVQWLRDGVPVHGATASSYRLSASDLGSRLLAVVRLTRPGYATLITRSVSTEVVRTTPSITVTTHAGRRRLFVLAAVTAYGVHPVPGVMQIRSRGRLVRQLPLTNGIGRATVTGLPRGTRTFRFRYVGTSKVFSGSVARRIRVR